MKNEKSVPFLFALFFIFSFFAPSCSREPEVRATRDHDVVPAFGPHGDTPAVSTSRRNRPLIIHISQTGRV